ncbi:MAG TPA: 4Fe-4S cluster-binding domain-containing protein [Candidatus Angelobacter sp.]
MKTSEVIQAWKSVLSGRRPSLAIEITRECPLRCSGCYAYEEGHVGGLNLRQLQDKRGDELVAGVLTLVDEHCPLHLSLVGGDPLLHQREVTCLLPQLDARGIHVQVVTSAFRQIPEEWARATFIAPQVL